MSKTLQAVFLALSVCLLSSSLQAQFTAGNLAIFRADASGANNTTFSIIELSPSTAGQAAPVQTISINGSTGLTALRTSGSAGTTGYLSNSDDGSLLCFTGHNTTTTSGNINNVTARGVGTLDAGGNFTLATTYTGGGTNQTRGATTPDNHTWYIGDQGGIYTNLSTTASPSGNFRSAKAFGGNVYFFQAGTLVPVSTVTAPSGATPAGLPGLRNGSSAYQDFYMVSSGNNGTSYDLLYMLATAAAGADTILKYSLVGGSWVSNGFTFTSSGGYGLAAARQGSGVDLYVTTGTGSTDANSVIRLTDEAGYNTDISINTANNLTLYTAAAGTTLKGIAFAPTGSVAPTLPQMRITEYMYKGNNGEFIEFTNVGNSPVNMNGWSYADADQPGDVSLSAFGMVQPGESVILTETDAADFRAAWGLCNGVKVIGGNSVDNMGRAGEIHLFDAAGVQVDSLKYGDNNPDIPAGSIRTENKSGWVNAVGLGANIAADWTLSVVGDGEGAVKSSGGDIGSPGMSTRAVVAYAPCTTPPPGAPTISIDVAGTSNYLDGGLTSSPVTPYAVSGALGDPSDPASTQGIVFTIGDDLTSAANLTVSVVSDTVSVVPNANLTLVHNGSSVSLKISPIAVGHSNIKVTVSDGSFNTSYILNYAASSGAPAGSNTTWLTGIADASAAIPIDDDYMVIANDEDNSLYVYDRKASGLPVKTADFNPGNLLALTDGAPGNIKEVDVEAATPSPSHAGRSYWLGSMSNSSSFNDKPNRDRIFATDISGTGASVSISNVGTYGRLRSALIAWGEVYHYDFITSAAEGKDPKTIDGFNAEGMVFAPDNTTLYIGLRAPLIGMNDVTPTLNRTRAIIAPIADFETWFNNGSPAGTPAIGTPIRLDLGGRGIRDMIRLSNGTYVIIAGSYDGTQIPAAFSWTGNMADMPVLISSFDLTGLNAEAAVPVNRGGQLAPDRLQIIADDGDDVFYNDGIAAKDLAQNNFKKFSSAMVLSSDGSTPLPIGFEYFTADRPGSDVLLSWKTGTPGDVSAFEVLRSENGKDYALVQTVSAAAVQTAYNFTDAGAPATLLYYRIRAREFSGQTTYSTIRTVDGGAGLPDQPVVKVYPNPVTNGVFTISIAQAGVKTVTVYNSAGVLVSRMSFGETSRDVPTAGWAKGSYLLQIRLADGSVVTEKVLVR